MEPPPEREWDRDGLIALALGAAAIAIVLQAHFMIGLGVLISAGLAVTGLRFSLRSVRRRGRSPLAAAGATLCVVALAMALWQLAFTVFAVFGFDW